VGEWMAIQLYHNNRGKLEDITDDVGLAKTNGMWNRVTAKDMDNDGDTDFVIGNMGLNTQFTASLEQPLHVYAGDFRGDGKITPIICNYVQGKTYPIATLDEIQNAIPALKKKFLKYADYADATFEKMFPTEMAAEAKLFSVYTLQTCYLENKGTNKFAVHQLPLPAQFSFVQGIIAADFTGDGKVDLLLSGNFFPYRVQYGPCDASVGIMLAGDGKGNFKPLTRNETGLLIQGDVRDMISLKGMKGSHVVISKNNSAVQVLQENNHY
jgi:hypothetical protein